MSTPLLHDLASEPSGFAEEVYDEFWASPGVPREHQRLLDAHLSGRNPTELEQLRATVRRRITQQEVTFNILGVPEGTNRPWQLDSIPLVIPHDEWESLCAGLRQRAHVLELVLADCYGPQNLVKQGLLPAALVFQNPGFLRPCYGWRPAAQHRLHLMAVDVGRRPDGAFVVYSDRASALTGAGYALENRLVLGRTLADLFRAYPAERLSGFFEKVRRLVQSLAPTGVEEPRIVFLSAGAQDETSFEHAYLARYLGYELVEGRDLTVRDDTVFLKTLSGLKRVDVIVRRVWDAMCDPLFLKENSTQGIAGLVAAARRGQVALANPLGASLIEAAALKGYFHKICRHFLGEDPILQTVPTLWLGEQQALDHVLGNLDDYVIKPAFTDRRGEPIRAAEMEPGVRERFINALRARPDLYVAEQWPALSRTLVYNNGALGSGHVAVRTFMCRDGADYDVMPGGLARVDSAPDGIFLSLRLDRASKDVWIPSPTRPETLDLPAMPDQRVELRRGGLELPSRLLDDIYWLGRYVERCEMTARVLRAGFERVSLEAGPDAPNALPAIMDTLKQFGVTPPAVNAAQITNRGDGKSSPAEVLLLGALYDRSTPVSLRASVEEVHRLTLGVRSRLSRDAWHVLRRLTTAFEEVQPAVNGARIGGAIEFLDQLMILLAAVSGTGYDNMVRGRVWLFFDMGRRVERGTMTVALLQAMLPSGATRVNMETLLEVADSLLTYRARYLSSLQAAPVVDLLLTDDSNPRSVAFQVNALNEHMGRLPRIEEVVRTRAEKRIIALQSSLLTADIEQACAGDGSGLRALLEDASVLLWQFSDDVSQTWFSHAKPSQAVAPPAWINEDLEAT